ncbi:folate-binding protein YgfZ [Synechococcus sp. PCC 7336]|uniref:CAF17-like 4Fe-4S cluster assembly/insertion protein YgfZ n=1 Tax=Synechococcus sp. PCC 7336 TaxID=195250 RepID=UPI0003457C80|nr:folate-binding protein YgfZ [Synechococcus sp. PCC 7336]
MSNLQSLNPPHPPVLAEVQAAAGAIVGEVAGQQVAIGFGNDLAALQAAREGTALLDYSHWTLLEMTGPDRLDYLHNQTTYNIKALQPGSGCETCIVTPTARLIDLVTAYITPESVLLCASPRQDPAVFNCLNRLLPFSNARLVDVGDRYTPLVLIGPHSSTVLESLGLAPPTDTSQHSHHLIPFGETDIRIAVGCGLALPGHTLLVPTHSAPELWQSLAQAGAIPMGSHTWERLRIEQGRPLPDRELTEDYNPLEAGLWHAVSFDKGCYIGQETIARLDTYNGVKQQLWGIELGDRVEPGTTITYRGDRAGKLTSITPTDTGYRGLAYLRTKVGGVDLEVNLDIVKAKTIAIPYPTRNRQTATQ